MSEIDKQIMLVIVLTVIVLWLHAIYTVQQYSKLTESLVAKILEQDALLAAYRKTFQQGVNSPTQQNKLKLVKTDASKESKNGEK